MYKSKFAAIWPSFVIICLVVTCFGQKHIISADTLSNDDPQKHSDDGQESGVYYYQEQRNKVNDQSSDGKNVSVNALVNEVWSFIQSALEWLDDDFEPCEDFFNYVCRKSLADKSSKALLMDLQRQRHRAFLFEQFLLANDNEDLLNSELKLKYFYQSCQSARSTAKLQNSLMYRMSGGGWPALQQSKTAPLPRKSLNSSWLESVSVFHEAGIEYLFKVEMKVVSNQRVVHVRASDSMRFSLKKYEQMVTKLLQTYIPELNEQRIHLVRVEIMHFERRLRDTMHSEMAPTPSENSLSYQEFQQIWPHLNWNSYFRKVMGKPLKSNDQVIIHELPRFHKLFNWLSFNVTQEQFLNWLWTDYLIDKMPENCLNLTVQFFGQVYEHIVQRMIFEKIHLAKMYHRLGEMYDELLLHTFWIDEITQQRSQQFRERVTYLSLNGNGQLDTDYAALQITNRNFYRNLEKIQRFFKQTSMQQRLTTASNIVSASSSSSVREFRRVVRLVSGVVGEAQHNLTIPLNYILLGEQFAELMIGDGLMAWRSLDSEHHYNKFKKCVQRQEYQRHQMIINGNYVNSSRNSNNTNIFNFNEVLILKMLAHQQSWLAFERWLNSNKDEIAHFENEIQQLLQKHYKESGERGNLFSVKFDLRQLYFIGTFLIDCQRHPFQERRDLLHIYLRNTPEFAQTFHCRTQQIALNARYKCKLL